VLVATIASPISPVTADYLASVIDRAGEENAALLVVELDTPGGLDTAMRQMVQAIIRSRVPVAVYVSPPGARADPPRPGVAPGRGRAWFVPVNLSQGGCALLSPSVP
jgi:nitrogenase molybdenum-iron protein alpha/beta subunit